jgi:hypothetical protein
MDYLNACCISHDLRASPSASSFMFYTIATFLNPTQRRDLFDNAWVGKLQSWIEVMLANCRDIWERDYVHLAPHKKVKRDAFEERLYRRKEEGTTTDEFRRDSTTGSAIPITETFDP